MAIVGFLKFLKREKKKDALDDLDLPPAPPPLEGFEDDKNLDFPDFDKEPVEGPEDTIPAQPAAPGSAMPEKDEFSDLGFDNEEMPDFPETAEEGMDIPRITAPEHMPQEPWQQQPRMPQAAQPVYEDKVPMQQPEQDVPAPSKAPRGIFRHERARDTTGRNMYVAVEDFKAALGHINIIRNDLRKTEEALAKLESVKSAKDKAFDKVKLSLDDLQKKLIFIDKTLFKGD